MKKERGRVEGFYILYKLLQLKNDLFLTRFIIYWCKKLGKIQFVPYYKY